MTSDEVKRVFYEIINPLVRKKIITDKRYIDDLLEQVQEQNRPYFLEKMKGEIEEMRSAIEGGDIQGANHHRVLAETYKSIIERCFE